MRYLALDIGMRRTGVASTDDATQVPVVVPTIEHSSIDELIDAVLLLVKERGIDQVIVGLPLLPSGDEGEQAHYVHDCVTHLEKNGLTVFLIDERYSTPRSLEKGTKLSESMHDPDGAAACAILASFISRKSI